jgi:hypothetical protein
MECAPSVRRGFFPLDEELQLLAGHFTPSVYEGMTRLGIWMPFARAVKEMQYFWRVSVTGPTVRRTTEAAGAAYVAVQTAEVEQLERTLPRPPQGPARQLMSVDGAYVPLVHKGWAEVKTLALGTVGEPVLEKGEPVVHTTALSYFSRLAEAEEFERLALVETHRRGTETDSRSALSRMGPSGNKASLTRIVKTLCGFWTSRMPPSMWRRPGKPSWAKALRCSKLG